MSQIICPEQTKAQLLAMVAMADGKVVDIEFDSAESLMLGFSPANIDILNVVFRRTVNEQGANCDVIELSRVLLTLEKPAKFDFIRACWYVAACDSCLHESEVAIIHLIGDIMGVSRDDSLLAKKSAG